MVISRAAFLTILTFIVLERLFELWLSARNARKAFAMGAVETGKSQYRTMVIAHILFLASAAVEASLREPSVPVTISYIAVAALILAQFLRYWAVITLGWRWNTRIIVVPGLAPVTSGPYRFIRHPNYLAVAIEVVALPAVYGCWLTMVAGSTVGAVLLAKRISLEEQALGKQYAESFSGVPRLLPKLRRSGRLEH